MAETQHGATTFLSRYATAFAVLALMASSACAQRTPVGDFEAKRHALAKSLERSLFGRDPVTGPEVLEAVREVPRHEFIPERLHPMAYEDRPLPIGHDQTISQPYIVAIMTQHLNVDEDDTVLEVGTGSGYQAAILAEIVDEVYTIEIVEELGRKARRDLERLGYDNVHVRIGDGYKGWPEHAPFDGIIVTAAPDHVPQPLIDQLKPGGRLVIPVGPVHAVQELRVIEKQPDGRLKERTVERVRFVPMTGEAEERSNED